MHSPPSADDDEYDDVPVDALDALYEDLALYASRNPDPEHDEAERLWATAMVGKTHRWLAGLRRDLVREEKTRAGPPPDVGSHPVEMTRGQLLASLEDLASEAGIRLVHSKLQHLSDGDLRRFLQTIDSQRRQS